MTAVLGHRLAALHPKAVRRLGAAAVLLVTALAVVLVPPASASPADDLRSANAIVGQALAAAQAGNLAAATAAYRSYDTVWLDIEDGIRAQSRDAYRAIEKQMSAVDLALSTKPPDGPGAVRALVALDDEQRRFLDGRPPAEADPGAGAGATSATTAPRGQPTVATLVDLLGATDAAYDAGDLATAKARFAAVEDAWLDVEGEIKTRSSGDYRATENDMARVDTALAERSQDVGRLLDGMHARLARYVDAGDYRPFDATVIVLREGLEALLVVVALLAFVRKSGNAGKQGWVWGGAAAGVGVSLAVGIVVKIVFDTAFNGANRELLEGVTGLVAAAMMLYVSYWLHSKTSLGAWKRYIGESTTRALARGSLVGLALLSFLAVFREGAETVLFLLGMAGRISTADLVLGLGIGAGILAVVGVLLTVVGVKLPVRPFFAVASVLTFYLCFKFVGTGIHSLQVAGKVGARTASFLPESDLLGLFPTWETTAVQAALLLVAMAILAGGRLRRNGAATAEPVPDGALAPEPEGATS